MCGRTDVETTAASAAARKPACLAETRSGTVIIDPPGVGFVVRSATNR
jgi:hypothetical protein